MNWFFFTATFQKSWQMFKTSQCPHVQIWMMFVFFSNVDIYSYINHHDSRLFPNLWSLKIPQPHPGSEAHPLVSRFFEHPHATLGAGSETRCWHLGSWRSNPQKLCLQRFGKLVQWGAINGPYKWRVLWPIKMALLGLLDPMKITNAERFTFALKCWWNFGTLIKWRSGITSIYSLLTSLITVFNQIQSIESLHSYHWLYGCFRK